MEAGPRNRAQQPDRDGAGAAAQAEDDPAVHDARPEPDDRLHTPEDGIPDGHPATLDASDGPDAEPGQAPEGGESFRDLRPPRRLRLWQLAPIVALAAVGSLMFAFPLAFEFGGDGGAVIAMLGLLLCCCAAGAGMMAARRVGHTWPGLPVRGSGRRASWRVVLLYAAVVAVLAALAIWRVARLR
ncbi:MULTISPECIES: hypothetical protein [Streptomyces]|uniref:Transmembrane protein n=1 Tax=Streptomyces yunnanensis TaxID=156453 RepID=A0ABY8ALJ4_9ACTN|nr:MULTISPECIES: hypothetical protein [Streptomyces]AJC55553.1 hypothetical protein GZL_02966 [Streptomyces sp. 769]WEB45679.1 hypothetical protein MOV08_12635 [Streptomyces yunnanensis]